MEQASSLSGSALLAWREALGISQAQLGKLLGMYVSPNCSCPTISRWESGIVPISESRRRMIFAVAARRRWPLPGQPIPQQKRK